MDSLAKTLAAIDAAAARDPNLEDGEPAALLYGRRMSARLAAFARIQDQNEIPSPALRIAARGQHFERWIIPRSSYPLGKAGYHAWRNAQKTRCAARLAEIAGEQGFDPPTLARIGQITRKERLKADPEAQMLEDVACLVFLEFYALPFAAKHPEAKTIDILKKTWVKMSQPGQAAALKLQLAPPLRELIDKALAR